MECIKTLDPDKIAELIAELNKLDPKATGKLIDEKIAHLFLACGLSFNVIESQYFIDLILTCLRIHPEKVLYYHPQERHTLSKSGVSKVEDKLEQKKKTVLENLDSCVMVDGWKNKNTNEKYLTCVLRNSITDSVFLSAHDNTLEKEDNETLGININNAIKLAQTKYGSNVVSIVTDNDVKIKAGARNARDGDNQPLLQSTCYSHSGNLLMKSLVDTVFTEQINKVITTFREPKYDSLLTKNLKGTSLKNYPDTRFCFLRNTCQSVLQNLEKLKTIADIPDVNLPEEVRALIFSDEFKEQLEYTIKLTTPVCILINTCQDATTSVAAGTELWVKLKSEMPSEEYNDKIDERIKQAVWPVGFAANMMDPKYKGQNLSDAQREIARKFMDSRLNDEGKQELVHFLAARDIRDDFADNHQTPTGYWNIYSLRYPNLGKLCLRMMMMPASTAKIESYFSYATFLHNKYRNRLSSQKSAAITNSYHLSKHFDKDVYKNTIQKRKRKYLEIN